MFQLILHHVYAPAPVAIDISGGDNHGTVKHVGYSRNGIAANSGALDFNLSSSRVSILNRPVFEHLHALKIEATVKLRTYSKRHNIVEGDNSFAFFIHPDGTLWGTALGRIVAGGPLGWFGAQTLPLDGSRIVPLNKWVKLTYLHDGFASIRLYIDDKIVASNYNLQSPVRPVGARGLHIGNWPAGDAYPFDGEIDEVKIWRWEPDAAYYNFFCRKSTTCWQDVFDGLGNWAKDGRNLDRYRGLLLCVGTAQTELIRAVRSKGEAAIAQNEKFSQTYKKLWCSGNIAGKEMKQLMEEWLKWLEELLGREKLVWFLKSMTSCFNRTEMNLKTYVGKCDRAFEGFIKILMEMDLN